MSPSPRLALLLAGVALATIAVGPAVGALVAVALIAVAAVDAWAVRKEPPTRRSLPPTLVRGRSAPFALATSDDAVWHQPLPPDLFLDAEGLMARRRGRHPVPRPAVRRTGPLGLGRWDHRPLDDAEVRVYPDLPGARRLALAVRQGRLKDPGNRPRGPLGLGTDFEAIRDYVPGDDHRAINWAASQRTGRPMANTYRVEQEREVLILIDAGRLMAAPLGLATRLDVAVDAAVAIAAVADAVGDRCGVLAFDGAVRRHLPPRRGGGRAVAETVFDLEPSYEEPDYERAFQTVSGGKRALIVVLTDLMEETAARPLADAVPVLARRHAMIVASATDRDLEDRADGEDPHVAVAATDVLQARDRAAALLTRAGAQTLEAPPASLPAACVSAYLRAKARARL